MPETANTISVPMRIEFAQAARDTRVWIGDTEITRRVVSAAVVADASEGGPTLVVLECVAQDGDKIVLTNPMHVKWNVGSKTGDGEAQ